MQQPSQKIYLSKSSIKDAGRGIFASRDIKNGETIELCPIILLNNESSKLEKSELYNYYFMWAQPSHAAIALGFGSLYNHSYSPNTTYKKHLVDKTIEFVAIKDIKKSEEITVNYNYGDPNDMSPIWIESIKPPAA